MNEFTDNLGRVWRRDESRLDCERWTTGDGVNSLFELFVCDEVSIHDSEDYYLTYTTAPLELVELAIASWRARKAAK